MLQTIIDFYLVQVLHVFVTNLTHVLCQIFQCVQAFGYEVQPFILRITFGKRHFCKPAVLDQMKSGVQVVWRNGYGPPQSSEIAAWMPHWHVGPGPTCDMSVSSQPHFSP